MSTYFTTTHLAVDIDIALCNCHEYLGMHDAFGVCTNHEVHDGLPCNEAHSIVFRIEPTAENMDASYRG